MENSDSDNPLSKFSYNKSSINKDMTSSNTSLFRSATAESKVKPTQIISSVVGS